MKPPPPPPLPERTTGIPIAETPPPTVKNEIAVKNRNAVWGMEPKRGEFAVEKLTIDDSYEGWTHLKYAKTIDAVSRNPEGAVVSIKSTGFTKGFRSLECDNKYQKIRY